MLAFPRKDITKDLIAVMFEEYFKDNEISYVRRNTTFTFREKYKLCIDSGYAGFYSCKQDDRYGHRHFQLKIGCNGFVDIFHCACTYITNILKQGENKCH